MLKIFLASHGKFASGIKNSIEILVGKAENLTVFDAYLDESNLKDQIDLFFKEIKKNDQVILLSDLYGGSVNQVMMNYLNRDNVTLISGVNLALVLELSIINTNISNNEIHNIIEKSRESLKIVNIAEIDFEEESFF